MSIEICHIDHLVLTVADIEATIKFYETILGMKAETFGEGRWALTFGKSKFNLHQKGIEFEPKALYPTPGAIDICLVTQSSISQIVAHLQKHHVPIEQGPILRTGAIGPINSVYIRDPSQNLVEISVYE